MNITDIPVGVRVPYIIGIPSVKAVVLGVVEDYYVLRQEYDTQDERGEWIHVEKYYYRDKGFINSYWFDTTYLPSSCGQRG